MTFGMTTDFCIAVRHQSSRIIPSKCWEKLTASLNSCIHTVNFNLMNIGQLKAFKKNPHLRICVLICERDQETLTACLTYMPYWKSNPQSRCVPWLGIEPATFWCMGQRSNWAIQPGLKMVSTDHHVTTGLSKDMLQKEGRLCWVEGLRYKNGE